ncbi:MAG TPA: carboxypeptidase regulatory-like domain-containing protein [Vicinamibacterales bacterium]|nr:carboxypeptidase regulatory-like domain-containing protein [Vicinamibacterales bacterium]
MPTKHLPLVALLVLLALAPARPALAQATGAITGVITDQSGAVMPGVTVDATNTATGQVRNTVTAADGFYTLPLLQPGRYNVKATLTGFKPVVRESVDVSVGDTSRADIKLTVGGIEESVTVAAETPLVETSHATLGITIDQQKITELPLNGRNFTQLGTLIPGVVSPPGGLGGGAGDATPGGFGAATSGFNVNGMRNQSNNFLLDGASNNDTFNTGFVMRPPPDAIQEFKIQTHSYSAEFGRNSGSVVNVVTRGGTNQLHGAVWEFNRDDTLQARNFFAPRDQAKPKLKQNQFGGSVGGPIMKNKFFGFGYYEGYRNTRGNTTNVVVLTDAQRTGDFASTTIRDPLTGAPFQNNVIPTNRISTVALKLIDQFVPRANSAGNRYIASPETKDNRDSLGTRFDYQFSRKHSLLGRYLRTKTDARTPAITQAIGNTSRATLSDYMGSDTFIFTPHAINVARFSYNRIDAHPAVTSGLKNEDFGINVPNTNPLAPGLAFISISGFFNLGDAQQPFVKRINEVMQFTDDFTWTRGNHNLKFGADVRKEHMVIAFINRPNGDFVFSNTFSGNAAADFLLGLPSQFRRTTTNQAQDGIGWLYSGYAQDEWRTGAHLTLNAGLRYELSQPFVDKNDALNAFHPGVQSTRFPSAPTGLVYPGDAGVPRGTYATDKNNFAPRLGAVWDPKGDGRTTFRGAWGLFYDALAGQGDFFQNGVLAPPFTPLVEVIAPPASISLATPLTSITGGATLFPAGLTIIGWAQDFTTPYAHHFNATMQRQIGRSVGVEAGYVGSRGRHLPIFMEVNPGVFVPGQTARGARIFPAFALVRPTFSVAESRYDSLQASARMRATRGMNFLASYTYGHARDHVSGLNIGGDPRPVLPVTIGDEASFDRALSYEWADALFDVRHRFVVSFGAELPTPRNMGRSMEHIIGGWQLNGIVQKQTGFPLSVTDPSNNGLDIRFLTNRPDATCDPNVNAPHTTDQWFNTSCFVPRPLATTGDRPGNAGRNSIRGPGFASTDLSLFKNVEFGGGRRIQVRLEAFNLFNQARFNQPSGALGTANFGKITTAQDGRVMQLGIKYLF